MKMNKQFWCLETYNYGALYYDYNKKQWVSREEYTGKYFPASFPCSSYKAAIRHLKKHDEIPKGTQFKLVSRFVGFDRIITKK